MNRERIEAKVSDREALAAALKVYQNLPLTPEFATITKAAYKYLAQLPEKCPRGGKSCIDGIDTGSIPRGAADCSVCHGSGKVYPAEVVERIEAVLDGHVLIGRYEALSDLAVAVLDALNGETE